MPSLEAIAEHSDMREARLSLTLTLKAVDETCQTGRDEQLDHAIQHCDEALTALKALKRAMRKVPA